MRPYGASFFFSGWNRTVWTENACPKFIKMGVNGVPVAPRGLILGENEATPSRKLFKHLPDLKTTINIIPAKHPNSWFVWIHYESTMNPLWIQYESTMNPLWIHVWIHLWIHYESMCESMYESTMNPFMNPLWIHHESTMIPLWIHYVSEFIPEFIPVLAGRIHWATN